MNAIPTLSVARLLPACPLAELVLEDDALLAHLGLRELACPEDFGLMRFRDRPLVLAHPLLLLQALEVFVRKDLDLVVR